MGFDYIGAKKAGVSDKDIAITLKKHGVNVDLIGAAKAGVPIDEMDIAINKRFDEIAPKKGMIKTAVDAIDEFAKDPIGNIIGKREHTPQEAVKKQKPQPHTVPQITPEEVKPKGSTPWDNLINPSVKIDTSLVSANTPEKLHTLIEGDKKKKEDENNKLNQLLNDAPLEDATLDTMFIGAGAVKAGIGTAGMVAGKVAKSKELIEEGAKGYAKGTAFAIGDAAGQVGAEVGMDGADALMTEEFKKNNPNAAEAIKMGAGLLLGGAAGYKAEVNALKNADINPLLQNADDIPTPKQDNTPKETFDPTADIGIKREELKNPDIATINNASQETFDAQSYLQNTKPKKVSEELGIAEDLKPATPTNEMDSAIKGFEDLTDELYGAGDTPAQLKPKGVDDLTAKTDETVVKDNLITEPTIKEPVDYVALSDELKATPPDPYIVKALEALDPLQEGRTFAQNTIRSLQEGGDRITHVTAQKYDDAMETAGRDAVEAKALELRQADEARAVEIEARKAQIAQEQAVKAEMETLTAHPRMQELIDMRREVSAKESISPNNRVQDRQFVGDEINPTVIGAIDEKNWNHGFALTKADIKAYESGKITPELVDKFKKDLDVLDNDPAWAKVDENPSADLGRVEGDKFINENGVEEAIPFSKADTSPKLYHVSSNDIDTLENGKTLWTTSDLDYAHKYGKSGNRVAYEVVPSENIRTLDTYTKEGQELIVEANKHAVNPMNETSLFNEDGGASSFSIQDNGVTDYLKSKGYDAVKTSESYKGSNPSLAVINPSKVKINKIDSMLSKGEPVINPHSIETMSKSLDNALGKPLSQKLSPIMTTINKADIPEAVLKEAKYDPEGIHGFVHEGKVYVVADNIPKDWTKEQVRGLVMHEIGVHLRKAGTDNKTFGRIVEAMKKSKNPEVKKAYERVPKETKPHLIDEEAMAYLVQNNPKNGIAQSIISWVKSQLIKIGVSPSLLKLTPNDLSAMAWGAVKRGDGAVKSSDTMFHAIEFGKNTDAAVKAKFEEYMQKPYFQLYGKIAAFAGKNMTTDERVELISIFRNVKGNVDTHLIYGAGVKGFDDFKLSIRPRGMRHLENRSHTDLEDIDIDIILNSKLEGFEHTTTKVVNGKNHYGFEKDIDGYGKVVIALEEHSNRKILEFHSGYSTNKKGSIGTDAHTAMGKPELTTSYDKSITDVVDESQDIKFSKMAKELKAGTLKNATALPEETKTQLAQRMFQDKFNRVKQLINAKSDINKIDDAMNPYQAEELFHGRVETRIKEFEIGVVTPILEKMSKAKLTVDEVDEYLWARHAPERNKKMLEKRITQTNMSEDEANTIISKYKDSGIDEAIADTKKNGDNATHSIPKENIDEYLNALSASKAHAKNAEITKENSALSGMSDADAYKVIEKYANNKAMNDIANDVYEMNRQRLMMIHNEGLESDKFITMIDEAYDNYVPLKREFENSENIPNTGKGFSIGGKEIKIAWGSDRKVESPFMHSILAHEETIIRAEKNEVGKTFLKFTDEFPDESLYTVSSVEHKPIYDKNGGVVGMDPIYKLADNVMHVKVDGKIKQIEIHDPALASAFKNLNSQQMSLALVASHKAIRTLAALNTSYNPEFVVSNFTRDIQAAMINLPEGMKSNRLVIARDVFPALNGIYASLRHGKKNEWSLLFEEMKREGGTTGWVDMHKVPDMKKSTQDIIDKYSGKMMPKQQFMEMLNYIDDVNGAVENASRLVAYKMAKESGLTNKKSASIAKNLTVNFNRKGEMGTAVNALYMFYNASIQGSTRMIQQLMTSRTSQAIVLGIAGTGIALDAYNRSQNKDAYNLIPDYIKDTNYIFMHKDGTYQSFKLPYGYNVFKAAGDLAAQLLSGELEASKIPSRMLSMTVNAFSPIGVDSESIIHTVSPTLAKPFVEIAENRNFFGGNITPENNPFAPDVTDSQNYYKSVNPIAKKTASALNDITGGNAQKSGWIDISPETIEHFVEFATGGLGKLILRTGEVTNQAIDSEKSVDINKVPFVRGFFGAPREKAETNMIYKMYDKSSTEEFSDLQRSRFSKWADTAKEKGDIDSKEYHKIVKAFTTNQQVIDFANKYNIQDKKEYLKESVRNDMREFGIPNRVIITLRKEAEKKEGIK